MKDVIQLNETEMKMLDRAFSAYQSMRFQETQLERYLAEHHTKGKTYYEIVNAHDKARVECKTWERALCIINDNVSGLNFFFMNVYDNMKKNRIWEPDFSEKFALAA